jgi:hypothetical protein
MHAKEEERNVRRAKHASIRLEMARRDFVIIDYSDDESNLSDNDSMEKEE